MHLIKAMKEKVLISTWVCNNVDAQDELLMTVSEKSINPTMFET